MTKIHIQQWDAFSREPLKGNPAAVVCKAEGLSDEVMQGIAREMNLSETAFVTEYSEAGHQYRFRWFTPADEVPFCGHATLGATFALCDQGMIKLPKKGRTSLKVTALIGTLELTVDSENGVAKMVWIGVPVPTFEPYEGEPLWEFLTGMGMHVADLHPTLEPWASHDQQMLYVPVKSLTTLESITPDFTKLGRLERDTNLIVVPFALETFEPDHRVHLRCFAPGVGIDEDPVTGAANAPLGALLFQQGVLSRDDNPAEYIAEQGDFVNRHGRVHVRVHHSEGVVSAVQIGGHAVKVLEGDLYL